MPSTVTAAWLVSESPRTLLAKSRLGQQPGRAECLVGGTERLLPEPPRHTPKPTHTPRPAPPAHTHTWRKHTQAAHKHGGEQHGRALRRTGIG